jgi:hypothetical protein
MQQNEQHCNILPVIMLTKNEYFEIDDRFSHSTGGAKIHERTRVWMRYDDEYLEIKFECLDNPHVMQNYYTHDNEPLFQQEVFEVFISNGPQVPERYLEIQINPNNALFLAKISYKGNTQKAYSHQLIDTRQTGVLHEVEKNEEKAMWGGWLKLPLTLLNYPQKLSSDTFRLNMFRIISTTRQTTPDWKCSPENAIFACWNSTMAPWPQFHKPECFGYLILK